MPSKIIKPLAKPIKYALGVPGSKSYMNRALICVALAQGTSRITQPNYCDDTQRLLKALQQLGVSITPNATAISIRGKRGGFVVPRRTLQMGNAGTATRFLTPLLPVGARLTGDAYMQKRPLTDLLHALTDLGFVVDAPSGCPPVTMLSREQSNSTITVSGKVSSQYLSALLLLAPTLPHGLTIQVKSRLVSRPYVDATIHVMKQFGIRVQRKGYTQFRVAAQKYKATNYTVPADSSSATYWWTLAAITGSAITVANIDLNDKQPDLAFLSALQRMGCTVQGTTVTGPQQLKPITIDMGDFPDSVMSLAVVAACAPGITTIKNIAHLTVKETDRLHLLVRNLRAVGITAKASSSELRIQGNPAKIKGGNIVTEHDHRFAMAFAILGLRTGKMRIDIPSCVKKSYPTFWNDLQAVQRHSAQQTIVLTGMRGSGKSTIGKQLAKRYRAQFIDTDVEIEKHAGISITEYVKLHGWKQFRILEERIAKRYARVRNAIIATGGGTLLSDTSYVKLKHNYIILLHAPLSMLHARVNADKRTKQRRPALMTHKITGKRNELAQVWKQRKTRYYHVADNIYDSRYPY